MLSFLKNKMKKGWGTVLAVFLFIPFVTRSARLVPCEGKDCDFDTLIDLVQSIINFLLIIAAPLAAILFAYAGWLYLSAGGSPEKVKKAHGIFVTVFWGLVIALAAWLVVTTIANVLLEQPSRLPFIDI